MVRCYDRASVSWGNVLELFTELAFLHIGVERKVIWVPEDRRNLAHRDPERQQLLDACAICVKLALLDRSLRFAEQDSLAFLRAQCFLCAHADQIALQFGQQRIRSR